jgi:hypothetical protein
MVTTSSKATLGTPLRKHPLWIAACASGALLATAGFIRFLIDAWLPTTDFGRRSVLSTTCAAAIYLLAGAYGAWRTHHVRDGTVIAIATTIIALVANAAGTLLFLAFWHDPRTLQAIHDSGGLEEHFTLLLFPVLPIGMLLGTLGGAVGKGLSVAVPWGLHR